MKRYKLLLIIPYTPTRIRVRSHSIIPMLSERYDVDVLYLKDTLKEEPIPKSSGHTIIIDNSSKIARLMRVLYCIITLKPITYYYYYSFKINKILKKIDLNQYQLIYNERLPISLNHKNVVFDCVDCFTNQVSILRKHSRNMKKLAYMYDASIIKRTEKEICNQHNIVLVNADREIKALQDIGVTTQIKTFIQVLGVSTKKNRTIRNTKKICFHGKLSYLPNELAIEVLNNLASELKTNGIQINVIGTTTEKYKLKNQNLNFLGFVSSLEETIDLHDLALFPMDVSVGFPNKIFEALAVGLPVITTPQVADAIPNIDRILNKCLFIINKENISNFIIQGFIDGKFYDQAIPELAKNYINCLNDTSNKIQFWEDLLSTS